MIPRWSLKCSQCFGSISNRHNHCEPISLWMCIFASMFQSILGWATSNHLHSARNGGSSPSIGQSLKSCKHCVFFWWKIHEIPVITQHLLTEVGKFGPGMLALRRHLQKVMKNWRIEEIFKQIFDEKCSKETCSQLLLHWTYIALVFPQNLRWGQVVKVFDFTFGPQIDPGQSFKGYSDSFITVHQFFTSFQANSLHQSRNTGTTGATFIVDVERQE